MIDGQVGDRRRPDARPPRRRRRTVISCVECHRRKQKCDRELPCANCRARNKVSHCTYESGAPTSRDNETRNSRRTPSDRSASGEQNEPLSSMATAWGYSQTGTSTIGFLKHIETADVEDGGVQSSINTHMNTRSSRYDSVAIREKYKGLVRQLPAKDYIDKLITLFMKNYNWQYYFVDAYVFYKQFEEWNSLSFKAISSDGPQQLSPDLRVFPAVLFQIIAIALLVLPEGPDPVFGTLKYAANMTFEDLACDYSESSVAIVNLLGKKSLSVSTVQAQFLQAHFLKLTGNVTEAWHSVSIAIRDAQELGMHCDNLDPKPASDKIGDILENQWLIQRRRNMYMILVIWDLGTAVKLGRPSSVNMKRGLPSVPIDAPLPTDCSIKPVVPRDENKDAPTPLTRCIWLYKLTSILQYIQDLEQEGPYPKDFSRVEEAYEKITALNNSKPAIFRLENPDTRWDKHPDLPWLVHSRLYFAQMHEFSMMALHRPYMIHRQESRAETLRASLNLLELQVQIFEVTPPHGWRDFMLFFGSFDAIVLIASIYILFPCAFPDLKEEALRHFHLTMERFSAMQEYNPLVRNARGVLKAIFVKLTKVIGGSGDQRASVMTRNSKISPSTEEASNSTPASSLEKEAFSVGLTPPLATPVVGGFLEVSDLKTQTSYPADTLDDGGALTGGWAFPGGIAPMYPTSDILFRDLTAIHEGPLPPLHEMDGIEGSNTETELGQDLDSLGWQFGGDFGSDTMWQFLNEYVPPEGAR